MRVVISMKIFRYIQILVAVICTTVPSALYCFQQQWFIPIIYPQCSQVQYLHTFSSWQPDKVCVCTLQVSHRTRFVHYLKKWLESHGSTMRLIRVLRAFQGAPALFITFLLTSITYVTPIHWVNHDDSPVHITLLAWPPNHRDTGCLSRAIWRTKFMWTQSKLPSPILVTLSWRLWNG